MKHTVQRTFLFIGYGLIFSLCSAQSVPYHFETISVDEGLSQSSVYSLYQDKRGFLWIGTADGLNRYDGTELKLYKAPLDVAEPYNANFIRGRIAEDKKENLWYYTENGLYTYDRSEDRILKKHTPSKLELTRTNFKVVTIDSNQRVWLFNPRVGFAFYEIPSGQFVVAPFDNNYQSSFNYHGNITVQNERNFWFVVKPRDGIYKFNIDTYTFEHYFDKADLSSIHFTKAGHYLIGYNTVHYYDSASKKTEQLPIGLTKSTLSITMTAEDSRHRFWIATTQDGLWVYDPAIKKTKQYKKQSNTIYSLPTDQLTCLLLDRNENLWIGTEGGGITKLKTKPPIFNTSVTSQQLSLQKDLFVKSIFEINKNTFWIGSLNNPIYILDKSTGAITLDSKINQLGITGISAIIADDEKNYWIGHEVFITKINSQKKIIASGKFTSSSGYSINKLLKLKDGRVAACTPNGLAIVKQQGDQLIKDLTISSLFVTDAVETKDEHIYVSSKNTGLHLFKKENKNYESESDFFENLDVKAIHIDKDSSDVFWLATDRGLLRFNQNSKKYSLYSERDGMGSSYVYGILEDDKKRIWCSTNGGLSFFDKTQQTFTNYTSKDGLQSNEFNTGAYHYGASGTMYFGGIKGVNWFCPADIVNFGTPPSVAITGLTVNQKAISDSILSTRNIELPYHKNDFTIQFSIFDYGLPEGNKIKYQLDGIDEKPMVSNRTEIRYPNLPPGQYTLTYCARTPTSMWSSQQFFFIVIHPPFWQRWWFYSLAFMLLVIFISVVVWFTARQRYKLRIVELEKQNALERERRRISMEMHDDIGANLTRIALISEATKHKINKENSLDQIAQTSRQVVQSMSEIIWSLNPDNKTFEQLMSYLRDQLHNLLEPSETDYQINLPTQGHFLMDSPLKRNIILLVKESVNNALKHSCATEINVNGEIKNNFLEVCVRDNGKGFNPNNGHSGNGIRNIKARATEINAGLKITSNERGTTVTILIPMKDENSYH
ncbi:MAG: hypothetical protein JST48_13560 [Bacteroidetes bacterium]|nr:hypothetical protein [Bacteroidota bacterium]